MLTWRVNNGDDMLKKEIQRTKDNFDNWFERFWESRCTREKMLSEDSPVEYVYYKMTKTFEEVKERYPDNALERCSDCGEYVDKWVETEFSFCDEYDCGMYLCKSCVDKLVRIASEL